MAAAGGSPARAAMRSSGSRSRPSPVLFVVVALALAVGAAASVLAGLPSQPAFRSGAYTELFLPEWAIETAIVLLFLVVLGLILYVFLGSGRRPMPGRLAVSGLAAIMVGILLVVLIHGIHGGGGLLSSGTPGNSTGPGGSTNLTSNHTGNLTGPGGTFGPLSLHFPPWVLFAVVAVTVLLVGAVGIPALWDYSRDRGRRRPPGDPAEAAEMRAALAVAVQELDEGREPRAVIIALYATVLRRVASMVGGVDGHTPEEIRSLHLVRLGIRPPAAETLTRLFEEARYSSHPMGPEAVSGATGAIREALEDLERYRPLP